MFFSKSTQGFYLPEIHGAAIPADAVEISAEEHAALLAAQSAGKLIRTDSAGHPVAVDPPPPSDAEMAAAIRAERNRLIAASDWTQLPDAPLAAAQKAAWSAYRQALRDVTGQETFPFSVVWPAAPV